MAEAYVTLAEAAELEGVKYKTMAQRLSRKKQAFETKTEKSETGGRDVVLVAVSSLSKQARNAWKEREKLKSFNRTMKNSKTIPETRKIIDFSESVKKKSNFFAMAVHSELMMELADGEIDPEVVFDILTSQGKNRVRERLCN